MAFFSFFKKGKVKSAESNSPTCVNINFDSDLHSLIISSSTTGSNGYPDIKNALDNFMNKSSVETIVIAEKILAPSDMSEAFANFRNLQAINGLDVLDTSNVTTMYAMFENCSSLFFLDLSCFNTSKVINMCDMFYDCSSLAEVNVTRFDTQNTQTMNAMFYGCAALKSCDLSSFDTSNVTDMSFMFQGCTSLKSLNISTFNTSNVTDMNTMFQFCDALLELKLSNFDTTKVVNMSYMFQGCARLNTLDISNFNTSITKTMRGMFSKCRALRNLDVSNFETSHVTEMRAMFNECPSLTSLDLSNFNTANVVSMRSMFQLCHNLTKLEISNFDTCSVVDIDFMFNGCHSLKTLDLSNFNTSSVMRMNATFQSCSSLIALDLSSFDTSNVTNMSGIFAFCHSLTHLDVSSFNTSWVWNMDIMFTECHSLTHLDVSSFDTSRATRMNGMFAGCKSLQTLEVSERFTIEQAEPEYMFEYCDKLIPLSRKYPINTANNNASPTPVDVTWSASQGIVIISASDTDNAEYSDIQSALKNLHFRTGVYSITITGTIIAPADMSNSFSAFPALQSIKGLHNLITSNVVTMEDMFANCSSLASLDLFNFDTSNVRNTSAMFQGCSSLTSLNISGFNTSKVTDMSFMFDECTSLMKLDISGFDTSNAKSMNAMFQDCLALTFIDIAGWKTTNVTNMSSMFNRCSSLTELDVSGFDTAKVTDMSFMFNSCSNLTVLDVSSFDTACTINMSLMFSICANLTTLDVSGFDTAKVTNMYALFAECKKLTRLDVSSFNTTKVTNMNTMFQGCSGLTALDVSSFNTSEVRDMGYMFCECTNLLSLDVSNFDTSKTTDMSFMFDECLSLTSLNLSNFDTSKATDMTSMFSGCLLLTAVKTTARFVTCQAETENIFKGCNKLILNDEKSFTDLNKLINDNVSGDAINTLSSEFTSESRVMSREITLLITNQCIDMLLLVLHYETISIRLKQINIQIYPAVLDLFVNDFEPLVKNFYNIYLKDRNDVPHDYKSFKALLHQKIQLEQTMKASELLNHSIHITELTHQKTLLLVKAAIAEQNKANDEHCQSILLHQLLKESGIVEQLARFELCFSSLAFKSNYEHGLTFISQPSYSNELAPDFINAEFDGRVYLYKDPNLIIIRTSNEENNIAIEQACSFGDKNGYFVPCVSKEEQQYFKEIIAGYIRSIYPKEIKPPLSRITYLQPKKTVRVGDILTLGEVTFSSYWENVLVTKNIDWRVLCIKEGNALVIAKNIIECRPYHDDKQCTEITWEQSDIRNWLNTDFLSGLSFKDKILLCEVANDDNPEYKVSGGLNTVDKVFLLSKEEAEYLFSTDTDRQAITKISKEVYQAMDKLANLPSGTCEQIDAKIEADYGGSKWMLRSPGERSNMAAQVLAGGRVGQRGTGITNLMGVRPALWISDIELRQVYSLI